MLILLVGKGLDNAETVAYCHELMFCFCIGDIEGFLYQFLFYFSSLVMERLIPVLG